MEMNVQLPDNAGELVECPDDQDGPHKACTAARGPYGMTYSHHHCAIDGCVMMAIGGGGDDGRGIDGYEDEVTFDGLEVNVRCLDKLSGMPYTYNQTVTVSGAPGTIVGIKRDSKTNIINDIKVRFDNGRELWFPPATFRPGIGGA